MTLRPPEAGDEEDALKRLGWEPEVGDLVWVRAWCVVNGRRWASTRIRAFLSEFKAYVLFGEYSTYHLDDLYPRVAE